MNHMDTEKSVHVMNPPMYSMQDTRGSAHVMSPPMQSMDTGKSARVNKCPLVLDWIILVLSAVSFCIFKYN